MGSPNLEYEQWDEMMIQAMSTYQLAMRMRELAKESGLPDYIEMLSRAADDLERRAAELGLQILAA